MTKGTKKKIAHKELSIKGIKQVIAHRAIIDNSAIIGHLRITTDLGFLGGLIFLFLSIRVLFFKLPVFLTFFFLCIFKFLFTLLSKKFSKVNK